MNRSLLRKELRSLAPFAALVLLLNLLDWADTLLTRFPDQFPLAELFKDNSSEQVLLFIVAFALASGLLVREADDGTLAFLDALPLSRARVFCVKVLLALGLLWIFPLCDFAQRVALFAWSRTSLEPEMRWAPFLTSALLSAASCFVYLSVGLALSFLRRFSLLALGLLFCSYLFLEAWRPESVSLFNLLSLSEPVFEGRRWLVPGTKLVVQVGLGLVCMAVAFGAFVMLGDKARRLVARARRRWVGVWLGGLGVAAAVVVWGALFVHWAQHSDQADSQTVRYQPWPTSRARTAHYGFLYPENHAGLVAQLLPHADAIEGKVRQFLRAAPVPWINADFGGSASHTAGQAHWKQVDINLSALTGGIEDLTAVLAHETTHVYIDHESKDRISDQFPTTRFFHEGLATYVEYHLFRSAGDLTRLRRVAAVARARREVDLDELMDDATLGRKRDTLIVYPLGEVFVAAIVNRYGDAAVGDLVRTFARPNAPAHLRGAELWRDAFQACGRNLGEVEDAFFALLDQEVSDQRAFIGSLPRLRGAVERKGDLIIVRVGHGDGMPGILVGRFRARADAPLWAYEEWEAKEDDTVYSDLSRYPERSFWYQLGWRVEGASQPIYEPWVETVLR